MADEGFIDAEDVSNFQFYQLASKPLTLAKKSGGCFAKDARASLLRVSSVFGFVVWVDPSQTSLCFLETQRLLELASSASNAAAASEASSALAGAMRVLALPPNVAATAIELSGDELTLVVLTSDGALLCYDMQEILFLVSAKSAGGSIVVTPFATYVAAKPNEAGGGADSVARFALSPSSMPVTAIALVTSSGFMHVVPVNRMRRALGEPRCTTKNSYSAVCWHPQLNIIAVSLQKSGTVATILVTFKEMLDATTPASAASLNTLVQFAPPSVPPIAQSSFAHDIRWPHAQRLIAAYRNTVVPGAVDENGEEQIEMFPVYVFNFDDALTKTADKIMPKTVRLYLEVLDIYACVLVCQVSVTCFVDYRE
jgi:hypothetical protein